MDDFRYSDGAENVLRKFYQKDIVVYVEGQDDIPFWTYLFKTFSSINFKIKDVGGRCEIEKYIDKIIRGDISNVVACDADFSYFKDGFKTHNNVIITYGYSIENTLLCEQSINKLIDLTGKFNNESITEDIINWIKEMCFSTTNLVVYDIANCILSLGLEVVGNNCSKFTISENDYRLCDKKIIDFIISLDLQIDEEDIYKKISDILAENNRNICDFLRGHFMFSAALKFITKFISKKGGKPKFSNDTLLFSLQSIFQTIFSEEHPHFQYYSDCINNIFKFH